MIKSMDVALALAACATGEAPPSGAPTENQTADELERLTVMDAYIYEISANGLAAMNARQTAEGMTYKFIPRPDGGWDVVPQPNAYWVAPERVDDHSYRERYWSPTVLIGGGMALVWAPYEFSIDGQTSHCGIDLFSFVKIKGVWKVSNSMWTVEPNACSELRPVDPSALRPLD